MNSSTADLEKRGFRAPGTGFMVGGGLIGAFGAYVFQWYGARSFDPEAIAPISILWTLFFILATILLVPVEQYITREVASGRKVLPKSLRPTLAMGAVGAVIGVGFVGATLDRFFAGDPQYIIQIALLCFGYAFLFLGKGVLAGSRQFAGVGWVMIIETMARLLVGVALLWVLLEATSMGWAMVIGGFAVLGLRWWRHDTGTVESPASLPGGFLLGYVGGTAPAQILLAGAPLAVAVLGAADATTSIVFFTFTLFRAPLTLIYALQGRVLPYLVGLAHTGEGSKLNRIAARVAAVGGGLALLGGIVGWAVGPWVMSTLYGTQYRPSATVAALAAAGVMAAAAAQVTSQVLVARGRTRPLGLAWLGGLAVAVVVILLVPGANEIRVAIGFVSGELTALGLMAFLAARG